MAEKRIIDLERVDVALEKLAKNPSLADNPREALNQMFEKLGIELTGDERRAFLKEVLSTPKSASAKDFSSASGLTHLSGIIAEPRI